MAPARESAFTEHHLRCRLRLSRQRRDPRLSGHGARPEPDEGHCQLTVEGSGARALHAHDDGTRERRPLLPATRYLLRGYCRASTTPAGRGGTDEWDEDESPVRTSGSDEGFFAPALPSLSAEATLERRGEGSRTGRTRDTTVRDTPARSAGPDRFTSERIPGGAGSRCRSRRTGVGVKPVPGGRRGRSG